MIKTLRAHPKTVEEVLQRYPRLTGHLISHSLGYFTPRSAANAILMHIEGRPFCCEWYCTIAGGYNDQKVIEAGRQSLDWAFRNRKYHTGFMAWYSEAKRLVDSVKNGHPDPMLASWF